MKKTVLPILLIAAAVAFGLFLPTCGDDDEDEKDCPSYSDYQFYPMEGGPDTNFELYVGLKDKSENRKIERMYAYLLTSDGQQTGEVFDLVRSDADAHRFLRAFIGDELCNEGVCNLYFKVYTEHSSGCLKGFDTDIFQVAWPNADDTSDDATDDATDDAADDATDDAADDTSDDTGDDTAL